MAKFAPVAPIQVLEQLYEHSPEVFGEYHLLLAHHTVEYEDRFRDLFRRIREDQIIDPIIIMDNSVVECGGAVDFDLMRRAASAVDDEGLQVIPVLPDVMGKGEETRNAVADAYEQWADEIVCIGFMAVCQGETHEDFMESLEEFANKGDYPLIEFLGIPRFLVQTLGSRWSALADAIDYLKTAAAEEGLGRALTHHIHLLGYSDDMIDDVQCSNVAGVCGIDSAVPLRVDEKFDYSKVYPPRPKDWFEKAQLTPQMLANLGYVRQRHGDFIQ